MPDLIAQGSDRHDRWRRRLSSTEPEFSLGRASGAWAVPWDSSISRDHAQLQWDGHRLQVCQLEGATNPVYFRGEPSDRFQMTVGDHFVIGKTRFSLVDDQAQVSLVAPDPVNQQTFSAQFLRGAGFYHAQQQVQALTRLPEVIEGAISDTELSIRVVNLILTGILTAEAAAVVHSEVEQPDLTTLHVVHWDCVQTGGVEFQPSGGLIHEALRSGQSVVHFWQQEDSIALDGADSPFDWAFCTPIPGTACKGQAIYVAGNFAKAVPRHDLQDALKFVELVSTTVGHVSDLRRLQERSATFAQFFSAPVRDAVAAGDPEVVLAPRKTEVSVLFCDLRGFSRQSEEEADDLFGLLQRVSEALGIMTGQILDFGGVVGDFHGDAAMGFWGWPLLDEQQVVHACQAALAIRASFKDAANSECHALNDFRVGAGMATGEAVAGKLGTVDQVKVTAFGPVVNLASRLEGLTRAFGVAILLDEATATVADQQLPISVGRVRRVARLQPHGMSLVEDVYELVPTRSTPSARWEDDRQRLNEALEAFRQGDWQLAQTRVEQLTPTDPIRQFYSRLVQQYREAPPENWDGVIRFHDKQ